MSVSCARLLSSAVSQIARSRLCLVGLNGGSRPLLLGGRTVAATASSDRTPSRSLWSSATGPCLPPMIGQLHRRLHTTGDHELADFLKDEIKLEKDIQKKSGKVQKIKNFEITKADGPNVVLTRKVDHETITVKFNVNNTVEDSDIGMEGEQKDESQNSQMTSRPPFVVEINKGGDKTLAIHCVFPHPDELPPPSEEQDQNEQYDDVIEIQDVALLNKSQEWTDDIYSLSSTVMDGNLYDMLLKLLEERGVDADFVQEVVDFSTSYEHKKYIELLEQLKEFADSK